mmetsp:Transcript_48939/g.76358  ORF Transcript_48939/g.76358 Transcript_48939/m.76358 type:complete len:515 (-) Transcript_48939:4435-5979(-)
MEKIKNNDEILFFSYFFCTPLQSFLNKNLKNTCSISKKNSRRNKFATKLEVNEGKGFRFSESEKIPKVNRRIPIITVIGRSNVGKSTLVNRLTEEHETGSIVFDSEGITRDRTYKKATWKDHEFLVVDTGGLSFAKDSKESFNNEIKNQALITLQEASVVIFLVDGKKDPNYEDFEIASFLRIQSIPIILVVNKCENMKESFTYIQRYLPLGLGSPVPVSSIHGTNTGELLDMIVNKIPKVKLDTEESVLKVAIIGRPNAGKSSLLNFLTRRNRAIVSMFPGTTRDPLESYISGGPNCNIYNFIDTAGIRRKKSINYGPEFFMVNRSFKTINKADCVLLVIDAEQGITEQDKRISERVLKEGKSCLILLNKWDLVKEKPEFKDENVKNLIRENLPNISWANVLKTSALSGYGCENIMEGIDKAVTQRSRHVSTSILNEITQEATRWRPPPSSNSGRQGKIYYCTQITENPPTISFFVNDPQIFSISYKRFIEGQLRSALDFEGTPLRLIWIKRK